MMPHPRCTPHSISRVNSRQVFVSSSLAQRGESLAARIDEPKFGYLSEKDRKLLRHAIVLRCEAFLTVERRLPRNAEHVQRELGIRILTPITHWQMLEPWAALWC